MLMLFVIALSPSLMAGIRDECIGGARAMKTRLIQATYHGIRPFIRHAARVRRRFAGMPRSIKRRVIDVALIFALLAALRRCLLLAHAAAATMLIRAIRCADAAAITRVAIIVVIDRCRAAIAPLTPCSPPCHVYTALV